MKTWLTDARYAARRLRARAAAIHVLAVLTLALGIGGTAAVFGLARPLIFDPLPYANANDVGAFWMPGWWTEEEFLYLRGQVLGLSRCRGVPPGRRHDARWRRTGATRSRHPGDRRSCSTCSARGRCSAARFQRGRRRPRRRSVAVISYGLWQELGGAPSIVGKRVTLDGEPRTIVGVMPRSFWFPTPDVRLWHAEPLDPEGRNGSYALIGRVAPGADVRTTWRRSSGSSRRVIGERFSTRRKRTRRRTPSSQPLRDDLLGSMRPALVATFVTMALILLIACTNVAALMLGQVEGRATELAVRSALGATRGRITQQLVDRSAAARRDCAASPVAALAALALEFSHMRCRSALGPTAQRSTGRCLPSRSRIALAAVLLVVARSRSLSLWRRESARRAQRRRTGGIHGRGGRLEHMLVVAEVALAMLIATGAALLVRSVAQSLRDRPGHQRRGRRRRRRGRRARTSTAAQRRQRSTTLTAAAGRDARRPERGALRCRLPLRGDGNSFGITIEGHEDREQSFTFFRVATHDYFATMGIALRAGRLFDEFGSPRLDRDLRRHQRSARQEILSRAKIRSAGVMGGGFGMQQRIVGVVANVAEGTLKREARADAVLLSAIKRHGLAVDASLVIRTARPARRRGDARRSATHGAARRAELCDRRHDDDATRVRHGGRTGATDHVAAALLVSARARCLAASASTA